MTIGVFRRFQRGISIAFINDRRPNGNQPYVGMEKNAGRGIEAHSELLLISACSATVFFKNSLSIPEFSAVLEKDSEFLALFKLHFLGNFLFSSEASN